MKFLFVHQNFPAQFLHIVRCLARIGQHEIVFITEPNDNIIAGVRKVPYNPLPATSAEVHWTIRELDEAVRRGERVAAAARNLRELGFNPDIIIGHHGWGELLALQDVWPSIPMLGYYEFFYHTEHSDVGFDAEFPTPVDDFPRIRAKNAVNLLALAGPSRGQTPTKWQLSTYPAWAQKSITLLPEGVDLDVCKPDSTARCAPFKIGHWEIASDQRLITYVARDLEPYR
ncbi:MAG: glycosyl transferase, partial [Acetobacteraceae bacterium]|nr:glycosyl transferase [Acetobacteraceae bacterium]